jgi:hypothetical protein
MVMLKVQASRRRTRLLRAPMASNLTSSRASAGNGDNRGATSSAAANGTLVRTNSGDASDGGANDGGASQLPAQRASTSRTA